MARLVCEICGYSLDDAEYEGSLSVSHRFMLTHMRDAHFPQVTYMGDSEKDEVVYRMSIPSGSDIQEEEQGKDGGGAR